MGPSYVSPNHHLSRVQAKIVQGLHSSHGILPLQRTVSHLPHMRSHGGKSNSCSRLWPLLTARSRLSTWHCRIYFPLSETISDSSLPSSSFVYCTTRSSSPTASVLHHVLWLGDHGSQPLRSLWLVACMFHGSTEVSRATSNVRGLGMYRGRTSTSLRPLIMSIA